MGKWNEFFTFGLIGASIFSFLSLIFFRYIKVTWGWSIAIALFIGIIFFATDKYDKSKAIPAVLTLLALIWAIYHQDIRQVINKPLLEVTFFEQDQTHLKELVGAVADKDSNGKDIVKDFKGWFITLQLINKGKMIAEDTQPFSTKIAEMNGSGNWEIDKNWMPIPLKFGEKELYLLPTKTDVIPERPYFFNIGSFSNARPGGFLIDYSMINRGQKETIVPGKYCFEITIYALKCVPLKKYIYIEFERFNGKNNMDEIKSSVKKIEIIAPPDIFK